MSCHFTCFSRTGLLLGGLLLLLGGQRESAAQTFGRSSQESASRYGQVLSNRYEAALDQPSVSPYLNLLQSQYTILPNYYTLVRPEMERLRQQQQQRMAIGRLQEEVQRQQRQDRVSGASHTIRGTGHPTRFGNYSHYYPALQNPPEVPQRRPVQR